MNPKSTSKPLKLLSASTAAFFACAVSCPLLDAETKYFGEIKEEQFSGAAKASGEKITAAYRSGGISEGMHVLESESVLILKDANAQDENIFFSMLLKLSYEKDGMENLYWALAIHRWVYRFGAEKGRKNLRERSIEGYFDLCICLNDYAEARRLLAEEAVVLSLTVDGVADVSLLPRQQAWEKRFPYYFRRQLPSLAFYGSNNEFLSLVSQMAAIEGNWRRALESAAIPKEQGMSSMKVFSKDANIQGYKALADSMFPMWRRGVMSTASCYDFLRLHVLAWEETKLLLEHVPKGVNGEQQITYARWAAALFGYRAGKVNGALAISDIQKSLGELTGRESGEKNPDLLLILAIAEIDFAEGRRAKSMEAIEALLDRKNLSGIESLSLLKQWCSQRIEMKESEGVEESLQEALTFARKQGVKSLEIDLYELYVKFLLSMDRLDEAEKMQAEHLRLLRMYDLFTRQPAAFHLTACILTRAGRLEQAEAALREARLILQSHTLPPTFKTLMEQNLALPLPEAWIGLKQGTIHPVNLQPRKVVTVPLIGHHPSAVFTLENLSLDPRKGVVLVQGEGLRMEDANENGGIEITAGADGGVKLLEVPVTLSAGHFGYIQITDLRTEQPGLAHLRWQPTQDGDEGATWSIAPRSEEHNTSTAIVDAAEVAANAFRFSSVCHLIQKDEQASPILDIRAHTSVAMRIEVYDEEGQLVFIDADGNGLLDGPSDSLHQDANVNQFADIRCGDGLNTLRFYARIRPLKDLPKEGATLKFDLLIDGKWITQIVDVVVP